MQSSEDLEEQLPERFGLVAGIVIGGLAFLVMVATVAALVIRKRKAAKGGLSKFELRDLDRGVGIERSLGRGAGEEGATRISRS